MEAWLGRGAERRGASSLWPRRPLDTRRATLRSIVRSAGGRGRDGRRRGPIGDRRGRAARLRFRQGSRLLLVKVGRGYDHHESSGPELAPSRRDAHGLHTEAILEGGTPASGWTAHLAWQREFVVRATGGEAVGWARRGAPWRSGPLRGGAVDRLPLRERTARGPTGVRARADPAVERL